LAACQKGDAGNARLQQAGASLYQPKMGILHTKNGEVKPQFGFTNEDGSVYFLDEPFFSPFRRHEFTMVG